VSDSGDRLVWIDCEMTGLDIRTDALIEVAALVTDSELTVLGDGLDMVITAPAAALAGMVDVVRRMHQESGLLDAVSASTLSLQEAEQRLLAYVQQYVPEPNRAPLCGNTISTDRMFLARDMPLLDAWLHYRMIDVSSIKELCRRWYPKVYYAAPEKSGGHRALADITESIAELRYYRAAIFVAQPGPDTAAARELAGRPPVQETGSTPTS
jgi:oligoribonuclease